MKNKFKMAFCAALLLTVIAPSAFAKKMPCATGYSTVPGSNSGGYQACQGSDGHGGCMMYDNTGWHVPYEPNSSGSCHTLTVYN